MLFVLLDDDGDDDYGGDFDDHAKDGFPLVDDDVDGVGARRV